MTLDHEPHQFNRAGGVHGGAIAPLLERVAAAAASTARSRAAGATA